MTSADEGTALSEEKAKVYDTLNTALDRHIKTITEVYMKNIQETGQPHKVRIPFKAIGVSCAADEVKRSLANGIKDRLDSTGSAFKIYGLYQKPCFERCFFFSLCCCLCQDARHVEGLWFGLRG